jgi:hypothetical protein
MYASASREARLKIEKKFKTKWGMIAVRGDHRII